MHCQVFFQGIINAVDSLTGILVETSSIYLNWQRILCRKVSRLTGLRDL